MIVMLATLLCVLVGIALAIFAVIAAVVGMSYLLWPVMIVAAILLWIGYSKGLKRGREGGSEKKPEEIEKK